MASEAILDFERLLAPISDLQPCGENLSSDVLFADIRRMRDRRDRGGPESSAQAEPQFAEIITIASDALATRTKDLGLAAFLTEALLVEHGFAGLRDGIHLMSELLEKYWTGLYPPIEQDADGAEDFERRAAPLDLLGRAEKLPSDVRQTALLTGGTTEPFSWGFWRSRQVAAKRENEDPAAFVQRKEEAEQRGRAFDERANALPRGFFVTLVDDLNGALAEVQRLRALVDTRLGQSARSIAPLEEAIGDCRSLAQAILKTKPEPVEESTVEAGTTADGDGATRAVGGGMGPLKSRSDALARLAEVAAFFRQTEPHSPISYLVQRAARWGTMSLQELMHELVKDDALRSQIGELLDFDQTSGSTEG